MVCRVYLRRYTASGSKRRNVIVECIDEANAIEEAMDSLSRPDYYVVERVEQVNPAEE